jgi:molybdate transport repressor ModE-like protein
MESPETVAAPLRKPWLGVELRHLATLAAVARGESFRAAAEDLGYVQSAVSQQVAALERIVGTRLVERQRGQRGVKLTPAGELLVEHARAIVAQLQAARVDLSTLKREAAETLRVGLAPGISAGLLPMVIPDVAQRLPGVELIIREVEQEEELPDLIEQGELDIAFGTVPTAGPFASHELVRDPYVLVVAEDSPVADLGTLPSPADIGLLRLIVPPASRAFTHVEALLAAHGISLAEAVRMPPGPAVQALVASGHGAAITSRLAIDVQHPGTRAIALTQLVPARTVALYWHRQRRRTPLIDAVRAALASVAEGAEHELRLDRELALAA